MPRQVQSTVAVGIAKRFAVIAFFLALQGVILFTAAGRLDWN